MTIQNYIDKLNRLYLAGNAREHSYRGDLQTLLASNLPADILMTNEPVHVACGTSDYVLTKYAEGKVFINDTQYFDNVPEVAWNFYIGGYQPAQKWLKDRKDIELGFEDIMHYNKIIVALTETDRLMKEIDNLINC